MVSHLQSGFRRESHGKQTHSFCLLVVPKGNPPACYVFVCSKGNPPKTRPTVLASLPFLMKTRLQKGKRDVSLLILKGTLSLVVCRSRGRVHLSKEDQEAHWVLSVPQNLQNLPKLSSSNCWSFGLRWLRGSAEVTGGCFWLLMRVTPMKTPVGTWCAQSFKGTLVLNNYVAQEADHHPQQPPSKRVLPIWLITINSQTGFARYDVWNASWKSHSFPKGTKMRTLTQRPSPS